MAKDNESRSFTRDERKILHELIGHLGGDTLSQVEQRNIYQILNVIRGEEIALKDAEEFHDALDFLAGRQLSPEEEDFLNQMSKDFAIDLDDKEVVDYTAAFIRGEEKLGPASGFVEYEPNKKAAANVVLMRISKYLAQKSSGYDGTALHNLSKAHLQLEDGDNLLNYLEYSWICDGLIRRIVQFDELESTQAFRLVRDLRRSDYGHALVQHIHPFFAKMPKWDPEGDDAENVKFGLQIYRETLGIYERGFPLLLGIKRIMDGEDPDLESLQTEHEGIVRKELTDVQKHDNSVYFLDIVKQYEPALRNAVAHGDYTVDPVESKVKIPNKNQEYSFSEINDLLKRNFSVAIILSGYLEALLQWQYVISHNPEFDHDFLPLEY